MKLVWRVKAAAELRRQIAYVRRHSPQAAERLRRRVQSRIEGLLDFPDLGRPSRREGVRELVIAGTPYLAVYVHDGETLTILRVFHVRQERG